MWIEFPTFEQKHYKMTPSTNTLVLVDTKILDILLRLFTHGKKNIRSTRHSDEMKWCRNIDKILLNKKSVCDLWFVHLNYIFIMWNEFRDGIPKHNFR